MRQTFILLIHLMTLVIRLLAPSPLKSLVAENLLLKQQLLVIARSRHRAPNLRTIDRVILGWLAIFLSPARLVRSTIIIKPATILRFHQALVRKKYLRLFGSTGKGKPGPKGPRSELVKAVVAIKRRNPRFGSPRIAQIITHTFGVEINKDVVRRILEKYYKPDPGSIDGPSWLSFIGAMKDSLWSIDLFKCESIRLRSHWVLVVMDQWSRKIIGFGIHDGPVDGPAVCRMFNQAISGAGLPTYLSSDHDPLFKSHRWQANLRIMGIEEIKTVPYTPLSHPYIERLIGTIRRECLDRTLFWNASDLGRKLCAFKDYYNQYRVHSSLAGTSPGQFGTEPASNQANLDNFGWKSHCSGLFQTPIPT